MKIKKINSTYESWKTAMINSDLVLLDNICDENFLWTDCRGITSNKTEILNKIALGNIQYLSWINEETTINSMKDVAVLRTKEILKMKVYHQKVNVVQQVIILFVNQDGSWKLVGGQETSSSLENL